MQTLFIILFNFFCADGWAGNPGHSQLIAHLARLATCESDLRAELDRKPGEIAALRTLEQGDPGALVRFWSELGLTQAFEERFTDPRTFWDSEETLAQIHADLSRRQRFLDALARSQTKLRRTLRNLAN